jgi:hypothetical protein
MKGVINGVENHSVVDDEREFWNWDWEEHFDSNFGGLDSEDY